MREVRAECVEWKKEGDQREMEKCGGRGVEERARHENA